MDKQIFLIINSMINNAIIEILPFLTLDIKDKFRKHQHLIYLGINIVDLIFVLQHTPTTLSIVFVIATPYIITTTLFKNELWKKY